MAPADIAALLDELPREKTPLFFRLLSKELAAEITEKYRGEEQLFRQRA